LIYYDNILSNTTCIIYGSEVWGVGNNFKDTEPFEHLQLKGQKPRMVDIGRVK